MIRATRRTAGLLAIAGALATAAGAPPLRAGGAARTPAGLPRTPDFVEKVDRAIDRGVLWLAKVQDAGGSFSGGAGPYPYVPPYDLGLQALGLYTVRACGLSADDPVSSRGLKRLRTIYDQAKATRSLQNYQVSLTLLALDAYYAPDGADGKRDRYGNAAGTRRIPSADLAWIRELVKWLLGAQTKDGSFGYANPSAGWEDHSNAQFSILALKAARRCGVEVPKSVFDRTRDHFLRAQERSGPEVARRERVESADPDYGARTVGATKDHARGWDYQCTGRRDGRPTGSMTAAGVSTLVICRGELLGAPGTSKDDDERTVQGIRDGIAWLGRNFTVEGNPPGSGSGWHYYYLYGLERAGVLAGVSWMADHDWYGEGADYLVERQSESGAWGGGRRVRPGNAPAPGTAIQGNFTDTCFALLFLKKATFRVEGAVATEESDTTLDLSTVADLDDDTYRAVFDTVFGRLARAGPDTREERIADFVRMGKRALPLLIRRLEDADAADRNLAIAVLERTTGVTLGFRSEDPVEARAAAVAAWEEWWFASRGRLSPDVGTGRFLRR